VVSSGLIQKRKYNKGYFVKVLSVKSTNSKLEAKDNDEMAVNSSPNTLSNKAKLEIKTETKLEERNNNSLVLLAMNNVAKQQDKPRTIAYFTIQKESCINDNIGKIYSKTAKKSINPFPEDKRSDDNKLNGKALAGFICSMITIIPMFIALSSQPSLLVLWIIGLVSSIILSLLGYKEIKHDNSKGMGFAIAGLIIEMIMAIFVIYLYLILPLISQIG
jgi:hypothetical protein